MKKPDAEKMSLRMEAIWLDAEERIMQDVIRRIRQNSKITSTADYQINRLVQMGKSTEEVEKILKEALNKTYPEMYELYDDVTNWQYVRNKDLYEQVNGEFIPPEENEELMQISSTIKKQTADELRNLAQSYGFAVLMGGKKVFTPFAEYYQKYVDAAIMDIVSGGYDYNTVIRRVVTQMTNSGLRTVDYASGWSNRTPVAVRRAVMTGVAQITGKVAEQNANALGTNHYEVDWHAGARPDHRVWQGKVYSYEQLISVCGLGTVTGLHGANCYHDYYPFIPGISERLYSDEWLDEQNRKEEQTKTWMGKEYNLYEQTQKQRQMETAMRAQREKVSLLKEAKADPDDIMIAKAKYQAQLDEYGRFCKRMGLQQQRERIYYDMRGRVAQNTNKSRYIANQVQKMYNKSSILDSIEEYEKDLKGLKKYREKVPNAELWHYRLDKTLHKKKLIMPKAYVVPAERKKAYVLEDLAHKKDPAHIMKRMLERNITDDQVQSYVDTAIFSLMHYNDTRLAYYSREGVTVLTKTSDYDGVEWITKTTWSKTDFDETTDRILKEAKKYAKSRG